MSSESNNYNGIFSSFVIVLDTGIDISRLALTLTLADMASEEGECYLCKKESSKYIKVEKMDVNVCKVISDIEGGQLSSEKLICHACYKQASRNIDNANFQPRWKPKTLSTRQLCVVASCNKVAHRKLPHKR